MPDAQRYAVTITYERVSLDGERSDGSSTRTVTLWALSPTIAKEKVERWAEKEFHRNGFVVTARATNAELAH